MSNIIALPERTRERLAELIRQRDITGALIDTTIMTAREAMDVPDDWTINDVRVGFVAPQSETPGD